MDQIKTIGIIGAGIMGRGIAIVAARSGYEALLYDNDAVLLEKGFEEIKGFLNKIAAKGTIAITDVPGILCNIKIAANLDEMGNCGLAIEAITENAAAKAELFKRLDNICAQATILASNTSSISISKLAGETKRPDKVVGMHFMNPVFVMPLAEIVCGPETSDETVALVSDAAKKMGKTPIAVNDHPGFVLNRLLIPMINEAVCCLDGGVATKEAIDAIMKLGANQPMGPLALADLIGLDTCLYIMQELEKGFNDPKYKPCRLLEEMVRENKLGRKNGHGFYDYGLPKQDSPNKQ